MVPEWLEPVLLYVEASEDLPQDCMPDSVKHLFRSLQSCETDPAGVVGASL